MLHFLYKTPTKSAYLIILFLALLSAIYNAYLPLHGDEAYYWMWSHHLQSGYYDHPPMIAYMIYLTNFISESEWGVRLVNVFSMSISALYVFKLSREMFDEKIALTSVIIFSSVILVHAGYILTTTDSPLTLFWTLTLYYTYRAIFLGKRVDYILAGIMLGLMMLSKYTAVLFIFALLFFILLKRRDVLKSINFYLAVVLALFVVSPMLVWNAQNEWISFSFQLGHGQTQTYEIFPHLLFEFFAGQFGIFSPVFTAILFYFLLKEKLYFQDNRLFFLALSVVVVLLLFFYKSLFTRMALNYTAPAYIGGAILTAYMFEHYKLTKTFKIGLAIALTLTLIGRGAFLFYLEVVQERMDGYREAVQLLNTHAKKNDSFYGDHLTTAAYLKYYLPNHPDTDIAIATRFSQYDMWRKKDFLKDGLVLTREDELESLKQRYNEVQLTDTLTRKKGIKEEKTFYIYRVSDAK